jgi:hypothetical protein
MPPTYHTHITLGPAHTRELIVLLIDIHGLLDHLHLDGANPQITAAANSYLRYTDSHHTLPTLIDAVDTHAYQLTNAMRTAVLTGPDDT